MIRFATSIDDAAQTVVDRIMTVAASLPEMQGASEDFRGRWYGEIFSADYRTDIRVSVGSRESGKLEGEGVGFIQIERIFIGPVEVTIPPALASTVEYAAGPMTGSHSTLASWLLKLGTDPRNGTEVESRMLEISVEQAVERVMDGVAGSIGTWRADGLHLLGHKYVDPDHRELEWRFVSFALTETRLLVVNTSSFR